MTKFFFKRFFKVLLTIWFIVTLVFVFTRLSGDPTNWILPDDAPESAHEELRQELGLNKPLGEQYVIYMKGLLSGDMGKSYYYRTSVSELFIQQLPQTIKLVSISFSLAIVIGVPLGVFAAVNRNSFLDRITMSFAVAGYTIPNFVLSILMIFLFSLTLRVLPSAGSDTWKHYIMPVLAIMTTPLANIARLTRSSMLDVLRQDYLDLARGKGVRESKVIFLHALRNALIPVVTIIGLQMGTLIGGSVVVETVFSWPGIGSLIVEGAQKRDFPVVQCGVLFLSTVVSIINFLVDMSYAFLDPRIRDNF